MLKLRKLKFLVLPFAVLGCVLLLASCKGNGKYYYRGNENNAVLEISGDKWIETYDGRTIEKDIEWISDTIFKYGTRLYYCDGDFIYSIEHPVEWYSSKPVSD